MRKLVLASIILAACGDPASGQPAAAADPATRSDGDPASAAAGRAGGRATIAPRAVAVGDPSVRGTVRAVHVVSRIGDRDPADAGPRRALAGDTVTLFALIEVDGDGGRRLLSDAGKVRWRGKLVTTAPLSDGPRVELAWSKIEPTIADMSNTASGGFRYETIPYAATPMAAAGGTVEADVHPTLTPDHGHGLGTMRFQVTVRQGDRSVASPGVDARRGRGSGGLVDGVHRISIRRDDTFLGYLTEMMGQPYIWASAGGTDRTHQSERLEGSDCADLMVFGARRMGLSIPYGWTGSLTRHARVLARGRLADDGVYRDAKGRPLPFTRAGDMVLFPRHVGALVEDRGTPGVLDRDDVMLHTLFDSPKEQPIAESGYADNPVEVLRWKGVR